MILINNKTNERHKVDDFPCFVGEEIYQISHNEIIFDGIIERISHGIIDGTYLKKVYFRPLL